jgi:hypothetical protein
MMQANRDSIMKAKTWLANSFGAGSATGRRFMLRS